MSDLKSFTLSELKALIQELGWESYRANQIFSWIWQKGVTDINRMTNLSKSKRARLEKEHHISALILVDRKQAKDGSQKFLFELADKNRIESVFIPDAERKTVCVSTQVGCPLQCRFCYTGKVGFVRNLKFFEIADQVLQIQLLTNTRITNIVFMGMGEPFLNYEETIKAIETINSDYGLNIGARKMTVSTVGIVERIYEFAEFPLQTKLAISLNAATDELRTELMPINKKYPLSELLKAVRYWVYRKNKRVTFEYVLIKNINDRTEDARALRRLLAKIPCKINLIPLNPYPQCEFQSPGIEETEEFAKKLYPYLPAVTVRKSRGSEILAGCGQLIARK
ncbi:MAG: 23S rRNA (adenine(2503)-C(2))-methyltransferase RlmN [candidate division WOR-3 bacterium]|nr:23S rRNA (adenine(2503)-C(2))-methyltransferase RlmN [candidate division WOR-3 bacterium]